MRRPPYSALRTDIWAWHPPFEAPSRYLPHRQERKVRFSARRSQTAWETAEERFRPARRGRLGDSPLVARKESLPLALIERVEERAKSGSFQPFDNGSRAGERMKVSRAPDVDMRRMGAQQAEIPVRKMPLGSRRCRVLELRRPRPVACDLAHEPMRRLIEIVRHLRGERSARLELGDERRKQRLVIRNPLQHGISEDHVERLFRAIGECRRPRKRCREDACAPPRSCRGGIEADDARLRVALAQDVGRIARAAANVGGGLDVRERNSRHEVAHGPRPLVFNLTYWAADQVICRRPRRRRLHATPSVMAQARAGLAFVVNGRLTFVAGERSRS